MPKAPSAGESAKVAPVLRIKKKRRKKNTLQRKAISEIKKYQQGKHATSTLIPKSCFARLARKTAQDCAGYNKFRFQDDALSGLQSSCESFLIDLLRNSNNIAQSSGRITVQANDIRLAHSIASGGSFKMLNEEEKKLESSESHEEGADINEETVAAVGGSASEDEGYSSNDESNTEEDEEDYSQIV